MSQKTYYITTPIYYVNDVPHIGHAYTTIICDFVARFKRLDGFKTKFLTGTDEHGQKVERSALNQNITPQALTDKNSKVFKYLMEKLNVSNDQFIRTTEQKHKDTVSFVWKKLIDNGAIYKGLYKGWYSMRDEAYYKESELINGLAPTGAPVEWLEEESYFFALSKFQDKLLKFYDDNPNFIMPLSKRSEVTNFVKEGLEDLSVSRTSFNWGIKVPDDEKHVIYVWLDALVNYISAVGYLDHATNKSDMSEYSLFWPANAHVVGKDILRFHAIYWPAFLLALNIELPKSIVAHGWWTNEGQKMSKSLGNVIDPIALADKFDIDVVRYFLIKEITFGKDGNFSERQLIQRNNGELVNKIGNLFQRSLSLVNQVYDGQMPDINNDIVEKLYKEEILIFAGSLVKENSLLIDSFEINQIVDNILKLAEEGNNYIDKAAPWNLKNVDRQKLLEVLYILLEVLRYIAIMLQPLMPQKAEEMLKQLSIKKEERDFVFLKKEYINIGVKIKDLKPLFNKINENF